MTATKRWFLAAVLLALCGTLKPSFAQPIIFKQPRSPRIANYAIDVTLIPASKTLRGTERLTWKNTSTLPVKELRFHLYLNAFRDEQSTFMREAGQHRGRGPTPGEWGWVRITSMELADGTDLTSKIEFIAPDDGNVDDRTVIRVPLPRPVEPNRSIILNIDFDARLPHVIARTGYSGEFFMVGQWFPKIGVLEEERGWKCHQFHANSEFYSDFGVYDLRITTPANYVVGATGVFYREEQHGDTTKTVAFHAEDVHDFAWTASPHFVDLHETWRHVDIRLLMQPEHLSQAPRYFSSARAALEYADAHIGPYPYPTLTIVDPPTEALEAGGMEYPTLITAGTGWGMPDGLRYPEMVTVHEFMHQYWYGMSANNEAEEAWLDEGLTQYYEGRILDATYGRAGSALDLFGITVSSSAISFSSYTGMRNPRIAPPATFSWKFPRGSYGTLTYHKTAATLATLEGLIGTPAMDSLMKSFFRRWQFKHPKGRDFVTAANEILPPVAGAAIGRSLDWYFDQTLYGTAVCDYAVFSLNSENVPADDSSDGGRLYRSTVTVARLGDLVLPVDVLVGFSDGTTARRVWDGRTAAHELVFIRSSPVRWAKVDPDRKIRLDTNSMNNSRTFEPPAAPVWKFATKALFWLQNLLLMLTAIG